MTLGLKKVLYEEKELGMLDFLKIVSKEISSNMVTNWESDEV